MEVIYNAERTRRGQTDDLALHPLCLLVVVIRLVSVVLVIVLYLSLSPSASRMVIVVVIIIINISWCMWLYAHTYCNVSRLGVHKYR